MTITFEEETQDEEVATVLEPTAQIANLITKLAAEQEIMQRSAQDWEGGDFFETGYVHVDILKEIIKAYENFGFENGAFYESYGSAAKKAAIAYDTLVEHTVFVPYKNHVCVDFVYLSNIVDEMPRSSAAEELVFVVKFHEHLNNIVQLYNKGWVTTASLK